MVPTSLFPSLATFRAEPAPVGGFRIEIAFRHEGDVPLIDLYQQTMGANGADLLHPQDGSHGFAACPCTGAPGWTALGDGIEPGEMAGPFVAWCAVLPERLTLRWCADDSRRGATFEVVREGGQGPSASGLP